MLVQKDKLNLVVPGWLSAVKQLPYSYLVNLAVLAAAMLAAVSMRLQLPYGKALGTGYSASRAEHFGVLLMICAMSYPVSRLAARLLPRQVILRTQKQFIALLVAAAL